MDSYEFLKKQYDVLKEGEEGKVKKLEMENFVLNKIKKFVQKKYPNVYKEFELEFRKEIEEIMDNE